MKKFYIILLLINSTPLFANGHYVKSYTSHKAKMISQYQLAVKYKREKGEQNYERKAFNCFHKSAQQGYTPAEYEFALMFHYGIGVRQNMELARLWFSRAAQHGHKNAQSILYRFYGGVKPRFIQKKNQYYSKNFRTFL
jgi:TPR repeat protein